MMRLQLLSILLLVVLGWVLLIRDARRPAAALLLALGLGGALQAQGPQSFHGSSNGWSPFHSDKVLHFAAGSLASTTACAIADQAHAEHPWLYGILVSVAVGLGKEEWDRHHGGRGEWADAAYTAAGGIVISIPLRHTIQGRRVEFATAPKAITGER